LGAVISESSCDNDEENEYAKVKNQQKQGSK
jgi:hypothetical protein